MKIKNIHARQVFDSRGNPTVEGEVELENGIIGRAIVPSGTSTGEYEAVELRDGGKDYKGLGVAKAIENVNIIIAEALLGADASKQRQIDETMIKLDGTENKSKLGANAILSISMAVAVAESKARNQWLFEYLSEFNPDANDSFFLPVPMMNVVNGGKHAPDGVDMQEFMIIPNGAKSFSQALKIGIETFHAIKDILKEKKMITLVGDEGGFAPSLKKNSEAIELILQGIEKAGYIPGIDVSIALDPAASEFFRDEKYNLDKERRAFNKDEMIDYWKELINKYPIVSVEDIMDQNDWEGWVDATSKFGDKVQIVGDDLLATNVTRLKKAIDKNACNSILIKLNQIGTVTEAIEAILTSRDASWTAVISHRSGETEDTFIADLVVAMGTGQIKTGSGSRTDRIAKYNQLLRIEEYLGNKAKFRNPFWK